MAVGFILWALFYLAVAAPAGRFDDEHISGAHLGLVEWTELGAAAVPPQNVIAARLARLAACHAMRAHQAMPREDGGRHRLEKPHAAHATVAASPSTRAAGTAADL